MFIDKIAHSADFLFFGFEYLLDHLESTIITKMAANKNTNDDADAIVARISIAQARLEASLRSFFPPPSKEDLDPEEKSLREREEEELFKPEPEP